MAEAVDEILGGKRPIEINCLRVLDEYLANRNVANNVVYMSKVPKVCKQFPCVLGIDEAGRGPVLGPMVYGIAFCPINRADLLVTLECDDSKALTEQKREDIFEKICDNHKAIGWAVDLISPTSICNSMLSPSKVSLNRISMESAIALVRKAIDEGVNIEHIFVDTVGPPEKYEAYLKTLFPQYKITVAKKADSKYPIVSAASIVAKVSRDHSLNVWKFREGIELPQEGFGSGYPTDPVTKRFLAEHVDAVFGYAQLVRFSWATSANALEASAYHVDFDVEACSTPEDNTAITSFFRPTANARQTHDRHEFFQLRCLQSASALL